MKFLAVIVTYNSMKWIEQCLIKLKASSVPVDICVIDNNSKDESVEFINKQFHIQYFYASQKNLGFGQANNIGLKYAIENSYDYVLLLNQDAYLDITAIEQLIPYLDENNIFSPIHLNGDGTQIDENFKKASLLNDESCLIDDAIIGRSKGVYVVPSVNAACWMFSTKLIREIGGFNPLFFHYGEDTNYAHRLNYHGGKFLVLPTCFVRHDRTSYGNKTVYTSNIIYRRLLLIYSNINLSFRQCISAMLINLFTDFHKEGLVVIWSYLKAVFKLLKKTNRISKSRKLEMRGQSWL